MLVQYIVTMYDCMVHDSNFARAVFPLLLIIGFAPRSDALLVFLQSEFVITALFLLQYLVIMYDCIVHKTHYWDCMGFSIAH